MTEQIERVNGRFAPGFSGNPNGRPPRRYTPVDLRQLAQERIDPNRIIQVVESMIDEALDGNVKAGIAIIELFMGKTGTIAPTNAGNNMDTLLAALEIVRQQRKEWEAQQQTQPVQVVIDVDAKVTQ